MKNFTTTIFTKLSQKKPFHIIVSCKANITRSVYFEAVLKHELSKLITRFHKRIDIVSAGVYAGIGDSANSTIQQIAKAQGLDISKHSSTPIENRLAKKVDLILFMEKWQKDLVTEDYPNLVSKCHTVLEYANAKVSETCIQDPTGKAIEEYEVFVKIANKEAKRIAKHLAYNVIMDS
ncbi:MAG: hypothetical protein MK193_00220 [Lentisphaeria bacterium]|nr:hypothetical protein [Lentisphaeria bacterium]